MQILCLALYQYNIKVSGFIFTIEIPDTSFPPQLRYSLPHSPMLSLLHYHILLHRDYFPTYYPLLPHSLHCTIRDLHHLSANNNVSILKPMELFAIFSDILCTTVVSVILTLLPTDVSNHTHVSFTPGPLCPPAPIIHNKIFYPHIHS